MRALVFLLVLANLLFFAFAQGYLGTRESPDALRLQQQLNEDKLRIAGREETPKTAPVPAPVVAPPTPVPAPEKPVEAVVAPAVAPAQVLLPQEQAKPELTAPAGPRGSLAEPPVKAAPEAASVPEQACLQLPALSPESADQLAAKARQAKLGVSRRSDGSWWVFIPPLADKKAADKKAGELQRLGVGEYFIVTEGPQKFAISLGVFSRDETAQKRLDQVRQQGVRSARVGQRQVEGGKQLLELKGDTGRLAGFRQGLPEGIGSKDCP